MSKKAVKRQMEYLEYKAQLDKDQLKLIRRFYTEYYGGEASYTDFDGRIITDDEMIREANRNHNSLYKDAFMVATNLNKNVEITDNEREIFEYAADETNWETALSQLGPEAAVGVIMEQFERDIKAGQDVKTVGARLIIKMSRFRRELKEQKRKNKEA